MQCFSSSDTGHGANNIISSTDDEDDEEVVFGAGACRFQPRFPPGAATDHRQPRGNDVNRLQTLDWYVVLEYTFVTMFNR